MKSKDERYPDYPLFKGLQRPLEFLGIQGRYIYWAAVTTCGAIVGFVAAYCLLGFIAGSCRAGYRRIGRYRAHPSQTAERTA